MIIDIYSHIVPQNYKEVLLKRAPVTFHSSVSGKYLNNNPSLSNVASRLQMMDKYEGYSQVLALGLPAIETLFEPKDAVDPARITNDGMAELVMKYPDRFVAAVASLPMNNVDEALKELDRAVHDLKLKGIQLCTNINGKPLDSPEFMPFFEKMANYDLPIWLHPAGRKSGPDYPGEKESKYYIASLFGREYETTVAMARLVFSGMMEKYPGLKIITHHFGGMISFLERRIDEVYESHESLLDDKLTGNLSKRPLDYFRRFYCDTAYGNVLGLKCVCSFFGVGHVLFGTDMPYDREMGNKKIRESIKIIEQMDISNSDKKDIFENNARRLLHLKV